MNTSVILDKIARREELFPEEIDSFMQRLLRGELTEDVMAAFLMGMRTKGETHDELRQIRRVLWDFAVKLPGDFSSAIDVCGTGGDGIGTFNVSTAVAFLVASMGVPVAKHGNRSISSASGSADVLEKLGIVADFPPEICSKLFARTGLCFLFAPTFHPALRHVGSVRRKLAIRTVFNIMGPLLNPANVRYQLCGAYSDDAAYRMALVLSKSGTQRAFVVHSRDGLDELSVCDATTIVKVGEGGRISRQIFDPAVELRIRHSLNDLAGGDALHNATILRTLFEGKGSPAQADMVCLNAAFALKLLRPEQAIRELFDEASGHLRSGKVASYVADFVKECQNISKE